ncbi:hypothetical protein EKO23_10155 [Nocardioides guangzhouensis]|uniref:Uncharacterized protein n=1 Tax=Nocardioides guangzhouensis TaxID=2497878 RepID=A0A4Q4ZG71_9ACTN|nr:hypothetical protein [Nocardioides guangzhouensis]RYP86304.1 hypothetical protein EKO23_10155 [Nocardioides guangzhouensis]
MASDAVDSSRSLLTLGQVDLVRVQVGYRANPDDLPFVQFLLDLSVPETHGVHDEGGFDERLAVAALEPALYVGSGAPRHYSLHQHRWHSSWGASPGALELGLLVTTGTGPTAPVRVAVEDSVTCAFRGLMAVVGEPAASVTSRDAAIRRARRGAATAYSVDPEALTLRAEEHHPAENSWTISVATELGEEYEVVVGLVDGHAGSVRVWRERPIEVTDSLGAE